MVYEDPRSCSQNTVCWSRAPLIIFNLGLPSTLSNNVKPCKVCFFICIFLHIFGAAQLHHPRVLLLPLLVKWDRCERLRRGLLISSYLCVSALWDNSHVPWCRLSRRRQALRPNTGTLGPGYAHYGPRLVFLVWRWCGAPSGYSGYYTTGNRLKHGSVGVWSGEHIHVVVDGQWLI